MENKPFRFGDNTDPSDEELLQIMKEVGERIREEREQVRKIHEQRLKDAVKHQET